MRATSGVETAACRTPVAGDPSELGRRLREERLAAGLSLRELSARIGRSPATLSSLEAGASCRHSTLQALLRALPSGSARALLTGVDGRLPDLAALTEWYERHLLVACRRLRLRLEAHGAAGLVQLSIEGLRSDRLDLEDEAQARLLLDSLSLSSDAEPPSLRRDHEGWHHRSERVLPDLTESWRALATLFFEPAGGRGGLLGLRLGLPADELLIELVDERAGLGTEEAGSLAWPGSLLVDAAHDVRDEVHPGADVQALRREGGGVGVRIARPLPGLAYGLTWGPLEAELRGRREARRRLRGGDLPAALRATRELGGRSQREFGRQVGLSPRTVANAESGRDPRRETLLAWLGAGPWLRPHDLFADRRGGTPAPVHRELAGYESASYVGRLRWTGSVREWTLRHEGLRALLGRHRELRPWGGVGARVGESLSPSAAGGDDGGRSPLRVGRRSDGEGRSQSELVVPAERARAGVDFWRRFEGPFGPSEDGGYETGYTVLSPIRELRMELSFPRAFTPGRARVRVRPVFVQALEVDVEELLDGVELERQGDTWTMRVREPVIGFGYRLELEA